MASRRLTDLLRSEQARRQREDTVARWALTDPGWSRAGRPAAGDDGDTLVLLLLCCHPSLSVASQIALTLRAVGGLSTAEIARALLGSEQTVTRRITRAKKAIKDSGIPFALPSPGERDGRLDAVLRVLYLIFNEGYASTAGTDLIRVDLAQEAIRLARMLYAARPGDSEVAGLLALMLLVHARHRARTAPDGSLVPMAEQDRSRWDRDAIDEGVALVTAALPRGPVGPYQLQAAIAAVHDEAENPEATDWRQITELYRVLLRLDDNPVVALNHAVAVSMPPGPGPVSNWSSALGPMPGSTPIVASTLSAATSSRWLTTLLPHLRRTEPQPGRPPTFSSSATSIRRSIACKPGRTGPSDCPQPR